MTANPKMFISTGMSQIPANDRFQNGYSHTSRPQGAPSAPDGREPVIFSGMKLESLRWYRVKNTRQFCQVTGIASTADPRRSVRSAQEGLKGFHAYLLWFSPADDASADTTPGAWTKRAILMELDKAFRLLREPTEDDLPVVQYLSRSKDIPLASLSVDGVKTEPATGT
jgi:hypothetical protein